MNFDKCKLKIDQLIWYHRKHGSYRLLKLIFKYIVDHWIRKSVYVFMVDLTKNDFVEPDFNDPIKVVVYSSIKEIPQSDIDQLQILMGPGRAQPFLKHFFLYGARLWLSSVDNKIIGLRWTLQGGFSGFYCMPIQMNEVVTLAGQIFDHYRGRGFFGKINSFMLYKMRNEGISRVYTGVHCRNASMLRAVRKARLQMIGRVLTISLPGLHVSLWRKGYLMGSK